MQVRRIRIRAPLAMSAAASALGFTCLSSPGPPSKATTEQVDQMNLEFSGGSTGFGVAPDWPAIMKAIRGARDSADRMHWISEFAYHAAALPESLRTQRVAQLQQLMREVR